MMRRLLIGISQFDDGPFLIRPSHEGDAGREAIGGESGRDRYSRNEHQECI
jgi:hypothetical protein